MVRFNDSLVGFVSIAQIDGCLYFSYEAFIESSTSVVYTFILLYFLSQMVTILFCFYTRVLFFIILGCTNLAGSIYGWALSTQNQSFTDHQEKAWKYDVYSSTLLVGIVFIGFLSRCLFCKNSK